jgi:TRAP-type C4-dicarboxylate transport system permease small subunit
MNKLRSAMDYLAWGMLSLAAVLGAVMSGMVFVSVTMRYVFLSPVRFTEEVVGLMFCAGIFLSMPVLFTSNRNIRVDLIVHRLPEKLRPTIRLVADVATIFFLLAFGYLTFQFAAFSEMIGAQSEVTQMPVAPWMAVMPFASFVSALAVAVNMVRYAREESSAPPEVQFGEPANL